MTGTAARRVTERRLLALVLGGAVLSVLAYLVAVRSGAGQILDDWAFEGRKATNLDARRAVADVLRVLTGVAVAGVAVAECVVAVRRRRWPLAVGAVVAVGGAVLLTTWLKDVLPRPFLTETFTSNDNTYPSGHMAAVAAAAIWGLVVCPPDRRGAVLRGAAPAAAGMGIALLGTGWHRPSDVVGAVALDVAWCGALAVLLVRPADLGSSDEGLWDVSMRRIVVVTLVLAVAVTVSLRLPANPQHRLWAYLVAVVAVAGLVFAAL